MVELLPNSKLNKRFINRALFQSGMKFEIDLENQVLKMIPTTEEDKASLFEMNFALTHEYCGGYALSWEGSQGKGSDILTRKLAGVIYRTSPIKE